MKETSEEKIGDRRFNDHRILTVGHVSNVPGTMESCPTSFCADPEVPRL